VVREKSHHTIEQGINWVPEPVQVLRGKVFPRTENRTTVYWSFILLLRSAVPKLERVGGQRYVSA
jgi:hypothetical protein